VQPIPLSRIGDPLKKTAAPSDKIEWLDQQHIRLIDELDQLNTRLEQTLSCLLKPTDQPSDATHEAPVLASAG